METEINRMDFITKIFKFYKVIDENGELKRTYDRALSVRYSVDWYALYEHIIKTAETRILPLPKYFVDKLSQFKKQTQAEIADEGCIIRVTLDNGGYYDFTVVRFDTQVSLGLVKKKFGTKIKKVVQYPKETTFIGDNVYFNVSILGANKMPNNKLEAATATKEEELKKQIKVLFTA